MSRYFSSVALAIAFFVLPASPLFANEEHARAKPASAIVAVPTFHSIGVYWRAASGRSDRDASLRFRRKKDPSWKTGHNLWFDGRVHEAVAQRGHEYRSSIVGLEPGTEYEIEVRIAATGERALTTVKTWSERFPIGKTVRLPLTSAETLHVSDSGSPGGYVLYTAAPGRRASIDVAGRADYNIVVRASYVIIRGLDLTNAGQHAIRLDEGAHHVVIEGNDISGWGRIAEDGFGFDGDSGISNEMHTGRDRSAAPGVEAIVIQNNRIHHPRSAANHWKQPRPIYGGGSHPAGPQAITLQETRGNHVIRYNEIFSDDAHFFNDCIGGGENFSYGGAPGPDSDVYGNKISHCYDDAIESEGGNANVRIWGNFLDRSYVMVGASPTVIGPLYIFRNVAHRANFTPDHNLNTGIFLKAQSRTHRDAFWGGGRVYVYHNTLYRTAAGEGTYAGISDFGTELTGYVSRNNIFDNTEAAVAATTDNAANDFDFDLYAAPLLAPARHEVHGLKARPHYAGDGSSGPFALAAGTPGHDDGVFIPNFSDGYKGKAPDRGAQERGRPPLRFGVGAGQ